MQVVGSKMSRLRIPYSKENELVNVNDRPETEHFGFVVVVGGKVLAETELAPTVRKLER